MTPANPWFLALLLIVVGSRALDFLAHGLNLRAVRPTPPPGFESAFPPERYAESQRYLRAHTRLALLGGAFQLAVFLAFWLGGGFAWAAGLAADLPWPPLVQALALLSGLVLAGQLLALPFTLWDTFVLEARHGFNRTTPATFAADQLKSLAISALLGLPLLTLLLHLLGRPDFWLWAWLLLGGVTLLLAWLGPRLLLPLFHRFRALDRPALEQSIRELAEHCRFPFTRVEQVDGSRRSTKANAFFTGFAGNRRIGLYDTLLEKHSDDEIRAVLAHEIGHARLGHVPRMLAAGLLQLGLLTFGLQLLATQPGPLAALGLGPDFITHHGLLARAVGLLAFGMLYTPVGLLLGLGMNALSRRHEFEADAYAARALGTPQPLVDALTRLAADQLANLAPHPLLVALEYSHPPLPLRVERLRREA